MPDEEPQAPPLPEVPEPPPDDVESKLKFSYLKWRQDFGRQPQCLEDHHRIHANVKPLKKYRNIVLRKTKLDKEIQATSGSVLSPMNTTRTEFKDFSMNHYEGGWPKYVNTADPEQVEKHLKKLEMEDSFQDSFMNLEEEMTELIKYNNTMNFYRKRYKVCRNIFGGKDMVPHARIAYKYPRQTVRPCRVSRIIFAPDNVGRMAVAHCPFEFDPSLRFQSGQAYFWEVEIPSRPEAMIKADSIITDIRYHPKDLHSICGSLFTGQVATWDNRVGAEPTNISPFEISHQDVCTSAVWINSKSGTEFMSCGLDGQVIWWDERKITETLDSTWCDPEKGMCRPEKSHGAMCLEYEHTLPTKFLAGTERGNVMIFMKKGKTPQERLLHLYKAHRGPVRVMRRNPMFIKNFITVGDYQIKLFAEDCRESQIMWSPVSRAKYYDANWLPTRPCSFVACRADGYLEWFDLLRKGISPVMEFEVTRRKALTAVCAADGGKFVAAGTLRGDVVFVQHTDSMGESAKSDKPVLAALFEREVRREKFIEVRHRENRLKKRDADKKETDMKRIREEENAKVTAAGFPDITDMDKFEAHCVKIRHQVATSESLKGERTFFESLRDEIKEKGVNAFEEYRESAEADLEKEVSPLDNDARMVFSNFDLAGLDLNLDEPGKEETKEQAAEAPAAAAAPAPGAAPVAAPSAAPPAAPPAPPAAPPAPPAPPAAPPAAGPETATPAPPEAPAEAPPEPEAPADAPAESEAPADAPAESEAPADASAESESPAESDAPADAPAEPEAPAEAAEAPATEDAAPPPPDGQPPAPGNPGGEGGA